jgi:hypothetical protein
MGALTTSAARYWVVFLQPLPEAGERIALALVFDDGGKAFVEYDRKFAKALKLYPGLDTEGLAFSMESLRSEISGTKEIEAVINSYGPQIAASTPRRIALPITEEAIQMLAHRYIYPQKAKRKSDTLNNQAVREIEAFVRQAAGPGVELRSDVGARDIVGHPIAGVKAVALAIPGAGGWTLIDGVDLDQLQPRAAISRADEIARTFWNYSRAVSPGKKIRRVGLVLNGHSHLEPKTHEAHDYALHRFEVDSDLALDTSSTESSRKLADLLAEAISRP